ncbi:MAG: aspartate kinase [Bacteroidota bacterium]|nr:aspartate kinase [Bacteroidota bacterium]MDP4249760.1 aspartate kinase [Bacteroidota bacterium]
MKVFKFGGASVNSTERVRSLPGILRVYPDEKLLIVVSAMGKTTNALEAVAQSFYSGDAEKSMTLFADIKKDHLNKAESLLPGGRPDLHSRLQDIFTEIEWLLLDKPTRGFDYYYDQIVCLGELLSSSIISDFLNETGIFNQWLDVRDVFATDDQFRSANLEWHKTEINVREKVEPFFRETNIILTQGFIGATDSNESTTLGREGSDYSAAIFANLLNADSITIWKDVEGIMNADPKVFPDARFIRELDYDEVIEMAFYGAQVIHPKTIKPLQNKNIPLLVKCFLEPALPGTRIHSRHVRHLPPIIVLKKDQTLIHLRSRDFSFVGEEGAARLYSILSAQHVQANLMQTGAVILQVCVDHDPEKIEKLVLEAGVIFDISVEKGLTLLTIRHYQPEIVQTLINGKEIVLQQWSLGTVQTLIRGFTELQP